MKGLLCALLATVLLLLLVVPQEEIILKQEDLTDGIGILRSKVIPVYGNKKGSSVRITSEMMRSVSGNDTKSVLFKSIPDFSNGRLEIDGEPIEVNKRIDLKDNTVITFIPHHESTVNEKIVFTKNDNQQVYEFALMLGDEEQERTRISCGPVFTYKNVAVSGKIRATQGEVKSFIITKGARHGHVELQKDSGKFRYVPHRNFTGTDHFSCVAINEYGNQSQEIRVCVKTEKAKQNLYFYDCKDNPVHKSAILLCDKGIMSYETDSQGLPIFSPDKAVTLNEFLLSIKSLQGEKAVEVIAQDACGEGILSKNRAHAIASNAIGGSLANEAIIKASKSALKDDSIFTREDCAYLLYALYENTLNDSRN